MITIRVLLISLGVLILCLFILPRTSQDKIFERKIIKFLAAISCVLTIIFSFILLPFSDTLLRDDPDQHTLVLRLQKNPNLERLSLNKYDMVNVPIKKVKTLLQNQSYLTQLYLHNFDQDSAQNLFNIFAFENKIKKLSIDKMSIYQLKYLLQKNTPFTLDTLEIHYGISLIDFQNLLVYLNHQQSIQYLNFEDAELSTEEFNLLVKFLKNYNIQLQQLTLNRNKITDKDLATLAHILIDKQTNLKTLELKLNHLSTIDKALATNLSQLSELQTLDLSFNRFDDNSIIALLKAFKHHPTLSNLYLLRNPITDKVLPYLEEFIKNTPKLQHISIKSEFYSAKMNELLKDLQKQYPSIELIF